jgi:hypothetical protein
VPQARFDRDERAMLKVLAPHPYRSVSPLQPPQSPERRPSSLPSVERRPLSVYSRLLAART